jgi:RimJ/RimL family protein N-acetyltransferase
VSSSAAAFRITPAPVVLEGRHARLEPLDPRHADALFDAGRDERIWTYLPRGPFADPADARGWIDEARAAQAKGLEVPFAIVHAASGNVAGSTRFLDIRPADRGLEIGWTWIAPAYQRTPLNTECKYLLLRYAFEALGATRVQLKTDSRNVKSQIAIDRIGATREGTLRHHMIVRDGYVRDSVFFSVTETDWPLVKQRLERFLDRILS